MALQNILKTINEQTSAEILQIKQDAEKQAGKILSKAQAKAKTAKFSALEKFREEKIQEAKAVLREKKNASYTAVLEKKKKILDDIFQQALKKLQESDIEKLKQNFPKNGEVVQDKQGGFKFISEELEIDNSLPSLIAEARQKLEIKIAKMLYA